MKYRKRPLVVEAEQYFHGKTVPGVSFFDERDMEPGAAGLGPFPYVTTIQGVKVPIKEGEWVIQERDGVHFYPCDPGEFKEIYESRPVKTQAVPSADDPLPWQPRQDYCMLSVNGTLVCGVLGVDSEVTRDYIIQAANAYPRLVAMIRSDLAGSWSLGDDARELLKELGEEVPTFPEDEGTKRFAG